MAFKLDFSSLFSPNVTALIGLDISSSSVKLVELSDSGINLRLERYAIEPLGRGAVVDGNIEKIDQVADAISRAVKKSGTKTRNVVLALPAASVITKRIQLPAGLSEQELEVQVESEANQYIPFSLEEVSLDFSVLGPVANVPDDIDVLIAASRKEKVEDRVAVSQSAGLHPVIVDIESLAARSAIDRIANTFENQAVGKILALFSIGANSINISVSLNGQSIYEREQVFGGNQLTQDIARTYGLSPEEAEAKKRSGDLPSNYEQDLLKPFVESIALEITRALQFFYTSTPYSHVDQLLIAGGCAVIPGLVDVVAQRTQVPGMVVNPFKGMDISSNVREKQLRFDAPALLVACGLAMRRFSQ